jgi:hypothetical protein
MVLCLPYVPYVLVGSESPPGVLAQVCISSTQLPPVPRGDTRGSPRLINLRFHFVRVLADSGNRLGQRIFS